MRVQGEDSKQARKQRSPDISTLSSLGSTLPCLGSSLPCKPPAASSTLGIKPWSHTLEPLQRPQGGRLTRTKTRGVSVWCQCQLVHVNAGTSVEAPAVIHAVAPAAHLVTLVPADVH